MKFPIVFAHRGANGFAPENSLSAFQKAMDLGCDGIELDVRPCADNHVIVFHDRNAYRMTGFNSSIHRLTLSDIKKLKLQQKNFIIEPIPTLQEVLDIVPKNILINIDVKKESLVKNGLEENILQILSKYNLEENIIISSFNPLVIKKIAILNPHIQVGYIFRNRSSLMMLNGNSIHSLHARYRILSNRYLKNLRARGNKIYAWTVDDEQNMIDVINKGVDGIITNRPEVLMKLKSETIASKNSEITLKYQPQNQIS